VQEVAGDIAGLIRRAKSHDRAAFGELYRCTVRPVYRYLSARLNTVEEAEELTQEVFLAAMSGIAGLRAQDETALLGWLFQIARHKLADHLRERYRRSTSPVDDAVDLAACDPLPAELAEAAEERAELREALALLTPEQREVVVLKHALGYTNERVARIMGKNANAVNQLHHRALASLHRLLLKAGKAG
jgi:RNA polymerase sigma-70 factor (ECF subfamily)